MNGVVTGDGSVRLAVFPPEEVGMFKATVTVESRTLGLEEITAAMGRPPDSRRDLGAMSQFSRVPQERSSWTLELSWPAGVHGGTDGLSQALEGLGRDLADRAGSLVDEGCQVAVSVLQELSADQWTKGVHLTAGAVRWIAAANASFGIDQYIEEDS